MELALCHCLFRKTQVMVAGFLQAEVVDLGWAESKRQSQSPLCHTVLALVPGESTQMAILRVPLFYKIIISFSTHLHHTFETTAQRVIWLQM